MDPLPIEASLELHDDLVVSEGVDGSSPLLASNADREAGPRVGDAFMPTRFGSFRAVTVAAGPGEPGLTALAHCRLHAGAHPSLEVHRRCATGELFGSTLCRCRAELHEKLERLGEEELDLVLFLHEGLKLAPCPGQALPRDTLHVVARGLRRLGIRSARAPLPAQGGLAAALVASGVTVVDRG